MNTNRFAKKRLLLMIATLALMVAMAAPAVAETFSAIVTSESMAVYSDAKMKKPAGTLERGEIVQIKAYSGKAAQISWQGKTGYARVADMRSVESLAVKGIVKTATKMYASPNEASEGVSVAKGAHVYVLSHESLWGLVERDGELGYMLLADLEKANDDWSTGAVAPAATPAPKSVKKGTVVAKALPVYKTANTASVKLGTLKQGQVVDVLGWNRKWAWVELDGKSGYCAVKGLVKGEQTVTEAPQSTQPLYASVTASKLPVYTTQSTSSEKLGTLKRGRTVAVLSRGDEWTYIELNGKQGYVSTKGLSETGELAVSISPTPTPSVAGAAQGAVNVSGLAVYKTASTKSEKLTTLSKGDKVNVLKWNKSWAYIESQGVYGFCAVTGLTRTDVSTPGRVDPQPSLTSAVKATVSDDSVAVYRTASSSNDPIGTLAWGDTVNVLSVSSGWAYIEKSGRYGFCKAASLSKAETGAVDTPSEFVKAGFTATVVYPGAKVYEKASSSGSGVGVNLGTELNVVAYSKDKEWACVANGDREGYIPVKHLSRAAYSTLTGSESQVKALLKALQSYGYYDGLIPASVSSDMAVSAIKRFQTACGLSATGTADQTVQRLLYGGFAPVSDMLTMSQSLGSNGENTKRLQLRLYVLGYLSKTESMDGGYGNTTGMAVALFQQANGMNATGVADAATLRAMYAVGAVSKPSSVKPADEGGSVATTGSVSGAGVVNPPSKVTLSDTYVTEMPASLKSSTSSYKSDMSSSLKLEHVIYYAQTKLGKPYVYGATGPNSYDCSGLTQTSFSQVDVSIKRSAYSQGYDSTYDKVSGTESLRRGDLVFFNTISDSDLSDHVGIYLGGGCFIHASSGGHKVVVSNLSSGYYNRVFSWGRRILK